MGALASGAAAAMGTGAFTAAELDDRTANISVVNDSAGLIGLEAGSTELVTNTGGSGGNELMIDFAPGDSQTGVNPDSTYQVGGLGEFDSGNIFDVPGVPTADPSAGDVAIDTTTSIETEHAFKVMNQTNSTKQIEVTYTPNSDFPEGARLYLVAYYEEGDNDGNSSQEEGLVIGDVANGDNPKAASVIFADQQYSDPVGAGDEFYVTIIVDVDEVSSDTDLGGTLTVRAGSHDEFTNADA